RKRMGLSSIWTPDLPLAGGAKNAKAFFGWGTERAASPHPKSLCDFDLPARGRWACLFSLLPRKKPLTIAAGASMLRTFQPQDGGLKPAAIAEDGTIPENTLWLDLLNPTPQERHLVDRFLGMDLPTRADMEEI